MGEEKPDEELMGKRKSSPRLSTASHEADDYILSGFPRYIHDPYEFLIICVQKEPFALFDNGYYVTIGGKEKERGNIRVRVIAGEAKGRMLKAVPGKQTRPTSDKVKEAIFSIIGPFFDGEAVLDLFAGTGGLGIEAWSRGAGRVIFVDQEKQSIDTIKLNLKTVKMEADAEIYRNDAVRAVKALGKRGLKLGIVFLDPPYKMKNIIEIMELLAMQDMLEQGAIIVAEHDAQVVYPVEHELFEWKRAAVYGEAAVTIYHYKGLFHSDRSENDDA